MRRPPWRVAASISTSSTRYTLIASGGRPKLPDTVGELLHPRGNYLTGGRSTGRIAVRVAEAGRLLAAPPAQPRSREWAQALVDRLLCHHALADVAP